MPPDTGSPRATLTSFIAAIEDAYYRASVGRVHQDALKPLYRAVRHLDLSQLPSHASEDQGIEAALMLKEVLDRVALPAAEEIPGDEEVARSRQDADLSRLLEALRGGDAEGVSSISIEPAIERWTIPDTEIAIGLVTEGPRRGEFLFTTETVERIPEFYARVRGLPYKGNATPNVYRAYISTAGPGLNIWWGTEIPEWLRHLIAGQTVWQWLALAAVLGLTVAVVPLFIRLGFRWESRGREAGEQLPYNPAASRLGSILALAASIGLVLGADWLIDAMINITGQTLFIVHTALIVVLYGLICWLVLLLLSRGAETLVRARRLRPRGSQSQLIRLAFKLIAIVLIPGILAYGAHQIGLPVYSVVTGLGVGGLAVALAARETLGNLFGSLMIMFDRPYRIGDWVKVGDDEGTVEEIGFRSTRIRTFYDSVLSIPNAQSVTMPIDNMGRREYRRVYTKVRLRYDTPPQKIEAFLEGIKDVIRTNPATRKDYFHVVLHDFGRAELEIMLYFFLSAPDWTEELLQRETVFLDIIRLAESLDVAFAFPTQTLNIEDFPGAVPARDAEPRHGAEDAGAGDLGVVAAPRAERARST